MSIFDRSLQGGRIGGSLGLCRMSITRNGNVALLNLRKPDVALLNLRKPHVAMSMAMSLGPKKGCVAMSILEVYISPPTVFHLPGHS